MSLAEIKQATKSDKTLKKNCGIEPNKWDELKYESDMPDVKVAEFRIKRIQDELTINDTNDLILKGTHIVIPSELHQRALPLAHEGHQGFVKTKQLLREKIWFPRID